MESEVIFHRLVQRDTNGILRYYTEEVGRQLADRFFRAFIVTVERAQKNPNRYHPIRGVIRRANISGFPYHFLYRKMSNGIRVLVLRHDKRHPNFGINRL